MVAASRAPWRRHAAIEHAGLVAELAQPAGHHGRPHQLMVGQHQPRALDPDPRIGRLDQLAARGMPETRQ